MLESDESYRYRYFAKNGVSVQLSEKEKKKYLSLILPQRAQPHFFQALISPSISPFVLNGGSWSLSNLVLESLMFLSLLQFSK